MAIPTRAIRFTFQDHRPAQNVLNERFAGRVSMPNVYELRQNANQFLENAEKSVLTNEIRGDMRGALESLQRQLRNAIATKERLQGEASQVVDDTSKEYFATLIKDVDDEMKRLRYEIEKIKLSDSFFEMSKKTDPEEIKKTRELEVARRVLKETPAMALTERRAKTTEPEMSMRQILGEIHSLSDEQDADVIANTLKGIRKLAETRDDSEKINEHISRLIGGLGSKELKMEVKARMGMPIRRGKKD